MSLVALAVSLKIIPEYHPNSLTPTVTPTPIPTSTPTSTPMPIPTPSPTIISLSGEVSAILNTFTGVGSLGINGTVTNNSPNPVYNVGLKIYADGYPILMAGKQVLINTTVPIASATYIMPSNNLPLSTLTPSQSIPVAIYVIAEYQSETPTLYDVTVTLIWSNSP